MTTSNMTLQEMIAARNELDARINAISSKRNEALTGILKLMKNFNITVAEIDRLQKEFEKVPASSNASELSRASAAPAAKKSAKKAATKKTTAKKATKSKSPRASNKTTSTPPAQDPSTPVEASPSSNPIGLTMGTQVPEYEYENPPGM